MVLLFRYPKFGSFLYFIFLFQHLTSLCAIAAECVSSLAIDSDLQMHMLQAGVLWHLLIFLFDYDFTLEESGVVTEEENSQQAVANKLAKLAVLACGRLAGVYIQEDLVSPKNQVTYFKISRLKIRFVDLKSNSALLYNKGHNF